MAITLYSKTGFSICTVFLIPVTLTVFLMYDVADIYGSVSSIIFSIHIEGDV